MIGINGLFDPVLGSRIGIIPTFGVGIGINSAGIGINGVGIGITGVRIGINGVGIGITGVGIGIWDPLLWIGLR